MKKEFQTSQEVKNIVDILIKEKVPFSIQINHSGNGKDEVTAFITKLNIGKLKNEKIFLN